MESSMEVDNSTEEKITPKSFIFSSPNVLSSTTAEPLQGQNCFLRSVKGNVYTFAVPTNVFQHHDNVPSTVLSNNTEEYCKPKITRNAFKPGVDVFTQALKESTIYERLSKNTRSQVGAIDIENSITCTHVPKELLSRTVAREFFSRYGHVLKISIRPKKQIITVYYTSKEDAKNAYHKCNEAGGNTLIVEWTKPESPTKVATKKKDKLKSITTLLEETDDEVKSELEAMTSLECDVLSGNNISGTGNESLPTLVTKKSRAQLPSKGLSKSIGRTEKAAVKCTDKLDPDSQIATPLHNASVEELQCVIRQVALTSEDKYKVLEARDRLMRLKRVKSHNLATAKATSGTCPDMCPEKERLMRESQRQLAPYEQLEGSEYRINHMFAVKQYSRSSADKEEPLSHELRPVESLKMTMSYLLHEIANLCEEEGTNLGEWYHFLWDRTRGIRKDITQQELCCFDSVELVEQCARFHIVCSERLCAEEASVFDKKINSENLTKCLQSLKYMYNDLRLKGIVCANEAEFRAYIVLLNLNNGNFMWDLQRLPLTIQKSAEVKFAIEVYNSLESNNYCKFFKLIKKTTYLNACILLRYFNQVRVNALSVMVKAYCRTTSTAYPLYELIDNLGFEDENEAVYFSEHLGLRLSGDGLHIMLDRRNFSLPESGIDQGRAHNLVESKRICQKLSMGRCIAGGKMPEKTYKNHKPHNSFDSRGYLLPCSINAEDQNVPITFGRKSHMDVSDIGIVSEDLATSSSSSMLSSSSVNLYKGQETMEILSADIPLEQPSNDVQLTVSNLLDRHEINLKADPNTFTRDYRGLEPVVSRDLLRDEMPKSQSSKIAEKDTAQKTVPSSSSVICKTQAGVSGRLFPPKAPGTGTKVDVKLPPTLDSIDSPNVFGTGSTATISQFTKVVNKAIFAGTGRENLFAKAAFTSDARGIIQTAQSSHSLSIFGTYPEDPRVNRTKEHANRSTIVDATEGSKSLVNHQPQAVGDEAAERHESEERPRDINEEVDRIFNELINDVLEDACCSIVSEETKKLRTFDTLGRNITIEILSRLVEEECGSILKEELAFHEKIRTVSETTKRRMIVKYFNIWKRQVSKRRRQREALSETPVWLQKQSIDDLARSLYRQEQEIVIARMHETNTIRRSATKKSSTIESRFAPIEMIVYAGIKESMGTLDVDRSANSHFFKLVISWPNLENKPVLWKHKRSINEYLHYGCSLNNLMPEPILKVYRPSPHESLYLSVRHFEGLVDDRHLIGMDGLLFIAAVSEEVQAVVKRLTKTVLSREKLMPIPLIFVALGDDGDLESHRGMIVSNLESLLDSGYVSGYTVAYEKKLTEKSALNLVQSAALWLSVNRSPPVPLEMDYLRDLYEVCFAEEFWLRILGHSSYNRELARALDEPDFVINLHNEAVLHFMDIVLDPESLLYTKFAPELKTLLQHQVVVLPCNYMHFDDHWKSNEFRTKLEDALSSLILPHWRFAWPIVDVQELYRSIVDYCRAALPNVSSAVVTRSIFGNLYLATGSLKLTSFIDVILYVVKEKTKLLQEGLKVVYNKNHIKHFRSLPWWLKSTAFTEYAERTRTNSKKGKDLNEEPLEKKRRLNRSHGSLEEYQPLAEFCDDTRIRILDVYCTSEELDNRLKLQQLQNDLFEQELREALLCDDTKI